MNWFLDVRMLETFVMKELNETKNTSKQRMGAIDQS